MQEPFLNILETDNESQGLNNSGVKTFYKKRFTYTSTKEFAVSEMPQIISNEECPKS